MMRACPAGRDVRVLHLRAGRQRRAVGPIALALVVLVLVSARASAQTGEAFLTANPGQFGFGETIVLSANFGASMDPYYYYIVGWEAVLRITGDNGYATAWAYDQWLDECYWDGNEGCGELYSDPWLTQPGSDQGPGQAMTATAYMAEGIAVFYEAICLEICWEQLWWVADEAYAQVTPQQPAPPPQCVTPPLLLNRGMRPATNYRYALQPSTFSPDEEQGIHDALAGWQAADANTGLATTFEAVGWNDPRVLGVVKGPLPDGTGAAVVDPLYDAEGYLERAAISYTNKQQFAFSGALGVRKAMRHEAGHLHALDHVDSGSAPSQSSVMLDPVAQNDASNIWPDAVTVCDAQRAYQAQFLPT